MSSYPVYFIDAFANGVFSGNTAAVVPLQEWLPDETMQRIAAQHKISETAFFIPRADGFEIRWFTPVTEVDLCGHATLATAHVIWDILAHPVHHILIHSKSGPLRVSRADGQITLDFPMDYYLDIQAPEKMIGALGTAPMEAYIGKDNHLLVYKDELDIINMHPDFQLLSEVRTHGVIVTSRGRDVDYVYRFFAPSLGINEDPATGSAQTTLTNYWSKKLERETWTSIQLSDRRGYFTTAIEGERALISGKAVTYLQGEINI